MNNLEVYLERLAVFLNNLVIKIEESPLFERALMKYESLEPKQQRFVRLVSALSTALLVVFVFLFPLVQVAMTKSNLRDSRRLLFELQNFNNENAVVKRPAPRPTGWQALPSSTIKDLENSLQTYSETMGIPSDFIEVQSSPPSLLTLKISELTLRQAVALLYQIDGWNPAVKVVENAIAIHPDSKDLLTIDLQLNYDATLAAQMPHDAAGGGGYSSGGRSSRASFDDDDLAPGAPTSSPRTSNSGAPGAGASEDFGEGMPPPALNFEEDL